MNHSKFLSTLTVLAILFVAGCDGHSPANKKDANDLAEDSNALESDAQKLGYSFGAQIAREMKRAGVNADIDVEALNEAFRDVFSEAELQLTDEQMQAAQQLYQQQQVEAMNKKAEDNMAKGEEYLASNKSKEGVQTTESGLQYEIIEAGEGDKPKAESTILVHYKGSLIDGTEFDSSYGRGQPAEFPVGGVIPGFSEGLQLMPKGAKYRLHIPSGLAYGPQAPESIGPNQVLIFDVELIEIK